MRVNLNVLTVEKLAEMLPQINDLETLQTAMRGEVRVSARKLLEERIRALQGGKSSPVESSSLVSATQEASDTREASEPVVPVEKPTVVYVKLVRGLSYRGQGVSFQQNEVRSVEASLAQSLLETGLFEEVTPGERRE